MLTAGAAGWLIGLMVWLLPSADASRALIIILLTYVIAICQFPLLLVLLALALNYRFLPIYER